MGEQEAHIRSHMQVVTAVEAPFSTPPPQALRAAEQLISLGTQERMTSDPRCLSSFLPRAFSHRHVFKALKVPVWDFWL